MQYDSLYLFAVTNKFELIKEINFTISEEELQKYQSFRKIGDRNNFIASRWIIDHLASDCNNNLAFGGFDYLKNGKPILPGFKSFNISHTDGLVVIFVSSSDVGVDTEKLVTINNLKEFDTYFSTSEMRDINSSESKTASFYYYWTIKEALAKYSGEGIKDFPNFKRILYLNDKELLYKEIVYNYESFSFKNYIISCIRNNNKKSEPIKVYECCISEDASLNYHEINYRQEKISSLQSLF